jgi:phosphate transport system substrate-binding protein
MMFYKFQFKLSPLIVIGVAIFFCISITGCSKKKEETDTSSAQKFTIQNVGSDTMVNLAQTWAEEYAKINPLVSVEVSGGGSGTGIAALINGTVDIANCSRQMEPQEVEKAKQNTGKEPQKFVVGYDALAVYIHKDNPLDEITIEQLAEIYGEGGKIIKWSQLGIHHAACSNDEIIRVSRQSNSGTYHYFREALLGNQRDFKLGSRDLHGSKDVVELVKRTPCAIGYSGMGYATEYVKKLKVAKMAGQTAYEPAVETTLNGTYPIARPLYMYTLGEPTGEARKYLEWIYSDIGQNIVGTNGYVPLPKEERIMAKKASGEVK